MALFKITESSVKLIRNNEEDDLLFNAFNPVEESFMAIYEMEYNTNNILRSIGITRLLEAEGSDNKDSNESKTSFLENVKQFFIKLWNKIQSIWEKYVTNRAAQVSMDRKFIEKNKENITKALNDNKLSNDEKFEGFKNYLSKSDFTNRSIDRINKIAESVNNNVTLTNRLLNSNDYSYENMKRDSISGLFKAIGINEDDKFTDHSSYINIRELSVHMMNENRGPKINKIGDIKSGLKGYVDNAISTLSSDLRISDMKRSYSDLKKFYKICIDEIDELHNSKKDSIKENDRVKEFSLISDLNWSMKTSVSIGQIVISTAMKSSMEERSQARKLLHTIVKKTDEG